MENYSILRLVLPFFVSLTTFTSSIALGSDLLDGKTLQPVLPDAVVHSIQPGSVLILGENHGLAAHRDVLFQIQICIFREFQFH